MNPSGKNVVLVVLDSARADHFGNVTRNYKELAARGMRFDRAIAPAGWTLPSHVSMFTGMFPSQHGAVALGRGRERDPAHARRVKDLAADGRLIAPRLAQAGIATFSASANPWVGRLCGLDTGFTHVNFFDFLGTDPRPPVPGTSQPTRANLARGIARSMRRQARWILSAKDKGGGRVLDGFNRFASEVRQPFFAFMNLVETHEPHFPPRTNLSVRWLRDLPSGIVNSGLVRIRRIRAHNWGVRAIPERVLDRWRRAYIAEIRAADDWLGRLMNVLDALGILDETVVMVTSDHGENFGENGIVSHGLSLHATAAHVPLAIAGPGFSPLVVSEPVSLLGIRATLDQILLDIPSQHSLLSASARGTAIMEIEDPSLISPPPPNATRHSSGDGAAFYDGDLKLVVDPFLGSALYNVSTDPEERIDLSGSIPPTPYQEKALQAWRKRTERFSGTRSLH